LGTRFRVKKCHEMFETVTSYTVVCVLLSDGAARVGSPQVGRTSRLSNQSLHGPTAGRRRPSVSDLEGGRRAAVSDSVRSRPRRFVPRPRPGCRLPRQGQAQPLAGAPHCAISRQRRRRHRSRALRTDNHRPTRWTYKPVGEGSPRLAEISLPWQQGSVPQHSALFHWIGHPR